MTNIERRFTGVETNLTKNRLSGYAAVYNTPSDIGPYWEMLEPKAFSSALASPDLDVVVCSTMTPTCCCRAHRTVCDCPAIRTDSSSRCHSSTRRCPATCAPTSRRD